MNEYLGTIVEESLIDNRFLNDLEVISVRISSADQPEDRWHLYKVRINEDQLNDFSAQLNSSSWYAHFWDDKNIVVVYPNKVFKMDRQDKETWQEAIDHGLSLQIPNEQLDFIIDE